MKLDMRQNLTFAVFFPIYKRSPNIYFLQDCRAISVMSQILKKMNMYKKRKRRKISKVGHFFEKWTLILQYLSFQYSLDIPFCIRL